MTDNQERKKFLNHSYVHEGFISAVNLFNDVMKILLGLDILNHIFLKT